MSLEAIGAPGDHARQRLGAVYFFERWGGVWAKIQKLTASYGHD